MDEPIANPLFIIIFITFTVVIFFVARKVSAKFTGENKQPSSKFGFIAVVVLTCWAIYNRLKVLEGYSGVYVRSDPKWENIMDYEVYTIWSLFIPLIIVLGFIVCEKFVKK